MWRLCRCGTITIGQCDERRKMKDGGPISSMVYRLSSIVSRAYNMTLPSADIFERVTSQAIQLLRKRYGPDLTLVHPRLIKDATRMIVVRADVQAATPPCASAIIKVIRDDPATGFTEWASLAFLADRLAARRLVPGWLGGDIDQRLFVIADLGSGN